MVFVQLLWDLCGHIRIHLLESSTYISDLLFFKEKTKGHFGVHLPIMHCFMLAYDKIVPLCCLNMDDVHNVKHCCLRLWKLWGDLDTSWTSVIKKTNLCSFNAREVLKFFICCSVSAVHVFILIRFVQTLLFQFAFWFYIRTWQYFISINMKYKINTFIILSKMDLTQLVDKRRNFLTGFRLSIWGQIQGKMRSIHPS